MAGTLTELGVAGRLAVRAVSRRLRSQVQSPPDLDEFTRRLDSLISAAPDSVIVDHTWLTMPAQQPPWLGSGLEVKAGDEVSYFVAGRVYANEFLDIYVNPSLQLWCKIGVSGEIFRGTRDSHSFTVTDDGEVLFGNYFPNDWVDAQGTRKQNDEVYNQVTGETKVLVIRWQGSARKGLLTLQAAGDPDGKILNELDRMAQGDTTPEGWHYLWHLGPAEIYRQHKSEQAAPCIHCTTQADVGILQKNVELELTEDTEISWRWCVDQLPSDIREDAVPSHDYLSIAVEFDNGRDITYYWSSSLPVGTGYDCPLPNWKGIEYHVAVRSGPEGLGEWQSERRNLYRDYLQYMGEPPARITRVWLIANSIFQRGKGSCDYSGIVLYGGHREIRVL